MVKKNPIQCAKYFKFFTHGEGREDDKINVFVFLSIDKPEDISSPHFILITYQELLDNVLNLIMVQANRYPDATVRYLKDFIDTLTTLNTEGKRKIASDPDTETLLKDFYVNHQGIIDDVVLANFDDQLNPDIKKLLVDFYNGNRDVINRAVFNGCKNSLVVRVAKELQQGSKFDIEFHGKTAKGVSMNKVVYEAIRLMLQVNPSTTPADIEEALNYYSPNKFWHKFDPKKKTPTGFTEEIIFGNGAKYLVHTQRYKTIDDTFHDNVERLIKMGFDIR